MAEHNFIWYGISFWSVGVSCPAFIPSHIFAHHQPIRVVEWEKVKTAAKPKKPSVLWSTVQPQPKHRCFINTVVITNQKHSTI